MKIHAITAYGTNVGFCGQRARRGTLIKGSAYAITCGRCRRIIIAALARTRDEVRPKRPPLKMIVSESRTYAYKPFYPKERIE